MVGGVVSLELLVGRVLHVNRVVSDDGSHGGVVAHHCLCALLTAQFQKGLQGEEQRNIDLPLVHKVKILNETITVQALVLFRTSCSFFVSCYTLNSSTSI